jgi:aspartyl-tRNA(Asn)/glutamyl-tRNA(Gln) amidotransferase subunit B
MEEGSLRCDANVSVRPSGSSTLGTKAEVKNLNSFRHVQRALEFEIARQTELLSGGGRVVQETRLWDTAAGRTVSMRSKEQAHDYRYFPEPDLPPVKLDPIWVEQVRATLPELPDARRHRFVAQYGLPDYDAGVLTQSAEVADYFEATATAASNAKAASNWVMGELMRRANDAGVTIPQLPITPAALGGLIRLVDAGTITSPVAKGVFETMLASGRSADEIVATDGLARIDDVAAIETAVRQVMDANADAVAQYRAGKTKTFGFLVGQVLKATKGKASPERVNELMRRLLDSAP